ncbi:MAG TPA: type 1 glutamine amidotransferase [Allosphingosinicella sp.]|nr:type 1 glutamine amidotransferase [Allosphingosinicella sp.]
MSLAILETGAPPPELLPEHGHYPAMFERLLGVEATTYEVRAGELPPDVARHEAYLVTGSSAGVYEDLPWIPPLIDFLRAARGQAKLVGICFGHQVMAQAFGGHVEKSPKGWGVGLHSYPVVRREAWMDDIPLVSAVASHQDQVVRAPPGARLTVSSAFTPHAGLAWDDGMAISFQFHPEMSTAFARALYDSRRDRIPDVDAAIASLDAPNDSARIGAWINRFLTGPR